MITVGLYPGESDCSAAVAVDGRVIAAIDAPCERNRRDLDTCSALLKEVLQVAGIAAADVSRLAIVDATAIGRRITDSPAEIWPGAPPDTTLLCRHQAAAAQLRGHAGSGAVIVHDDTADGALLFDKRDTLLDSGRPLSTGANVNAAAALVAEALSGSRIRPFSTLERIADSRPRSLSSTETGFSLAPFDMRTAGDLVRTTLASCPQLADTESKHVAVQTARAKRAATALDAIAQTLADGARAAAAALDFCGATGSAFTAPSFAQRLLQRLPSTVMAPVLDARGAALGAALLPHATAAPLTHVALGPDIDEAEIKATLENCRLDYVYEPDWAKLLRRVSSLLSTGALVGWYQGRRDFGGQTFGSRSVLADPSKRYVRENVNVFLLRRELHAPLPVSVLSDDWSSTYEAAGDAPGRHFAPVADPHGQVLVHRQPKVVAPQLAQLLDVHASRTGVPGLVNVPLADRNGRLVRTTRDAVREAFSSAVDVLVLGRFLVSKDYWLIRSR
jgi:predicted NodU family carbamoyl transferase